MLAVTLCLKWWPRGAIVKFKNKQTNKKNKKQKQK